MDHTHIVHAGDLDRYASTRESEAVIPELAYWLIKQSSHKLATCRVPYGDAVNQSGWDGLVDSDESFLEFVPKGKSYWEIGTGADPQSKATEDFTKRTKLLTDDERAESTFIFVTPRSGGSGGWNEPEQTKWLKRRNKKGWKLVRIIDGIKLADWLREFPAVGKWMAKKLNLSRSLGGMTTASEHWEDLVAESASGDPPIPPKLFIVGRDNVCSALQSTFDGTNPVLMLFAESPQDVADFVSAYLATLEPKVAREYSNRCLYISDEETWRSVVEARSSHVLVSDPRLGLETDESASLHTLARRRGHCLVIPLCGAWSGNSPEIIKLRSPSQSQIETVLKESGYSDARARELARIGADRVSALRRHLRGYGSLPPYATWDTATQLAQAGLVGRWDGSNPADRAAVESLLGKKYGEWIESLRPGTLHAASPLVQHDEKWRFVARGEAWGVLGSRITDENLTRFQTTAVTVLGERDPRFDLSKEDRFAANIHGKTLAHSALLRTGFAETLALLGSRPDEASSCTVGKAELTAVLVVRHLFKDANWETWAGLNSLMPLLAEAAPDEFLDAVESALINLDDTPLRRVFAEEGRGGIGGWNYMSGLLWALETLAWSSDHLSRVSMILADLASIDPGGNWVNRPSNSLTSIFLPWHVQTTASFQKRKSAIDAVLREQPKVGWKLLLSLLPHNHGVSSGCHKPTWRNYITNTWKEGVSRTEYWEQINTFTELAISLAKNEIEKLSELIERLSDLPETARINLLKHLSSEEVIALPEAERIQLWEKLDNLARQHQKFSDAAWALPSAAIKQISDVALQLAPSSPELKYQHLFGGRDFDLYDEKGSYEEQQSRLENARNEAVRTIINRGGVPSIVAFAGHVSAPYDVGRALGTVASGALESEILPSYLDVANETVSRITAGFTWARFLNGSWHWVDEMLSKNWSADQKCAFLLLLPFETEVWNRVEAYLKEESQEYYWRNVGVNPYGPDRELNKAIRMLMKYARPAAAVLCASRTKDNSSYFDPKLATDSLLGVLENSVEIQRLDRYSTIELIKQLQAIPEVDQDALFRVEWNFLPWLDRFSPGSPATLERRLANDAGFFAEVVALVFRPKDQAPEKVEIDERRKNLAQNAYRLLSEWRRCPGVQDDGSFDAGAFKNWIDEARRIAKETGHAEVAQLQIGHVLTCAPPDPSGFWIHETVASVLNQKDADKMRSGFTTDLFNQRGVFTFTHGKEERELAQKNREKADVLDSKGYTRFATVMRQFAEQYERYAEREENSDPFDD